MLIVTTVSVVLVKKHKPKYLKLTFLATLVIFSHLFIDLFFGYVAVAWPISNIAVGIVSHITTSTSNPLSTIKMDFQIRVTSTTEMPPIYESNLLTEFGVAILLTAILGL